jgi:hypothetical protein
MHGFRKLLYVHQVAQPALPERDSQPSIRALRGSHPTRKIFCAGLYQSGDEKFHRAEWFPPPLVVGEERGYTSDHPAPHVREVSMPKKERDREISRRRQKRKKMEFLKSRLAESKDPKVRAVFIQKILKINPQATIPQK